MISTRWMVGGREVKKLNQWEGSSNPATQSSQNNSMSYGCLCMVFMSIHRLSLHTLCENIALEYMPLSLVWTFQ